MANPDDAASVSDGSGDPAERICTCSECGDEYERGAFGASEELCPKCRYECEY